MMAPRRESRQKTFQYKRAHLVGVTPGETLAELLDRAVTREARPLKRAERLGEAKDDVRLINRCYLHQGMIAGVLYNFTEGAYQPTIQMDEEELELAIQQLPPRAKEQFIEGMLFFGILDNHVILVQGKGLRSREFEEHLNWLLGTHARVLNGGAVALLDEPSRSARERLRGVRSVVLRAPVTMANLRGTEDTPKKKRVTGAVERSLWDLLLRSGTFFEDMSAEEALRVEDVELSLEIKRVGRGGDGPSLIDELAHALRHADEDVFELNTRTGKIRSGELKIALQRSVTTLNGMPVLASVAEKMYAILGELIETGQVDGG